ncbi:MAG: T9SS type A sorting domain-containing protein [Bacteroidetes bacterium]|nr:T9SS type A sorting domain-containing protein [Bacteroidota bacterium]
MKKYFTRVYNVQVLLLVAALFIFSGLKAQTQVGDPVDGTFANDYFGFQVVLSGDGSIMASGSARHDGSKGHVKVYENKGGKWSQIGSDIDGAEVGDQSAEAIALSDDGKVVAIGANMHDGERGHVRVYENVDGTWTQIGADLDGDAAKDRFGESVSLSADGKIVAIGGNLHDGRKGHVRIFENVNGTWTQIGADIDPTVRGSYFGYTVSLSDDGSIVAVGAPYFNSLSGQVRVFKNISGTWTQLGSDLTGTSGENFGNELSISSDGKTLAVSCHPIYEGSVRVFSFENDSWTQVGNDLKGEKPGDQFGNAVSLSGDGNMVAVGSSAANGNIGRVTVYKNENGTWTKFGENMEGVGAEDKFGFSVALSKDGFTVAGGSIAFDGGKGQVRIYEFPKPAKEFTPIALSGFNHDVIAEGYKNKATDVTSTTFDNPNATGSDNVFYNVDFRFGPDGGAQGLPNNGLIKSTSNELIVYQLQAFDKNNVLLLTADDEGELVLEKASVFSKLSILSASAQGESEFTVTVTYSDNTTETESFVVADWFDGSNPAISGFGRVNRTSNVFEDKDNNPRLYDSELKVNPSKVVTKLKFSKVNSSSRTGIFAVCGAILVGTPDAPKALAATDVVKSTSFTANWEAVVDADDYYIDVATDENFTNLLADFNNKNVGNVTSIAITTTESTVYYRVRAHNKAGQSNSSNTIVVDVALSASIPQNLGIEMFPNPANNLLNISSANGQIEAVVIRDITGRIVLESHSSFAFFSFNISNLQMGMYTVSFTKNGETTAAKFIKL